MKQCTKLNIGCGNYIKTGYINLDSVALPGVDIVHNLNKYPWPFKDNHFEEITAEHVLEHLADIVKPIEELWRISKNHAKIFIKVPIFPSIWAMADPTHKQFFTYMTFDPFREDDNRNFYSKVRFKILKRKIIFPKHYHFLDYFINMSTLTQKFYYVLFSFIFPAYALNFELEVIK